MKITWLGQAGLLFEKNGFKIIGERKARLFSEFVMEKEVQ